MPGGKKIQSPELDGLNKARISEHEFSLEDSLVFGRMLAFTRTQQDKNTTASIYFGNEQLAVLKRLKPEKYPSDFGSEASFVWCFPDNGQNVKPLKYFEFGEHLAKYDDETVRKIARLVLRYMRIASRQSDDETANKETLELLKELNEMPSVDGVYSPKQLFAQLLGTAACEAGRAPNGFLSMLATMRRVKYQTDDFASTFLGQIFGENPENNSTLKPISYAESELIHAPAFSGSENFMRFHAELETGLHSSNTRQTDTRGKTYEQNLQRDIDEFIEIEKKGGKSFDQKVTRHYEAAERTVTLSSSLIKIPVNNANNQPPIIPPLVSTATMSTSNSMQVDDSSSSVAPSPSILRPQVATKSESSAPHKAIPRNSKAGSGKWGFRTPFKESSPSTSEKTASSNMETDEKKVHHTSEAKILTKLGANSSSSNKKRMGSSIGHDDYTDLQPVSTKSKLEETSDEIHKESPLEKIMRILHEIPTQEERQQVLTMLTENMNPQASTSISSDVNSTSQAPNLK